MHEDTLAMLRNAMKTILTEDNYRYFKRWHYKDISLMQDVLHFYNNVVDHDKRAANIFFELLTERRKNNIIQDLELLINLHKQAIEKLQLLKWGLAMKLAKEIGDEDVWNM